MYKYFTNNAKEVISANKKNLESINLKKIKASKLVNVIINKEGCYGKHIISSLHPSLKKQTIEKLKKGTELSAADLILHAAKIAYTSHSNLIGTEHLVQAFIEIEFPQEIKKMQTSTYSQDNINNQTPGEIQKEINNMLNEFLPPAASKITRRTVPLSQYTTNLVKKIANEPPLIGKEDELARLINILSRKNKNNPILIGDPGVGKTAIVEGLAKKINSLDVPNHLINKKILLLDLGQLVAGTTFRGEFEARLKNIMKAVKKDGNIILFIDEIHTLMGAGNAPGGMDAANILKPAMARGEIQIIGATTIDEYKKYIQKDAALERRLQPLTVHEPSEKNTVEILEGIRKHYENYHHVLFEKEALQQAPILAKKYIPDRFLPDSAIDLLDETAARKRSGLNNASLIKKYHTSKKQLRKLLKEKDQMVIDSNYTKALKARSSEELLVKNLQKEKKMIDDLGKRQQPIITARDILETVSSMTNISPELLSSHNSNLAKKIATTLNDNLVGQKHIKDKITMSILRHLSGISRQNGPLGSFLFVGPTGVGKTMTAKLLADAISPSDKPSLIQINMSEFTEKHSLSRLLGAPAGYVGHENEGELTDKITRKPFSIVLFDEIEKADPSILNILLQIFEDGELVNSRGKTIDFKNTIIILTSNIGTRELNKINSLGFESSKNTVTPSKKSVEKTINNKLKSSLTPELLARLDHVLIFDSLGKSELKNITIHLLDELKNNLEKQMVTLKISKEVINFIVDQSIAIDQGARLIRKNIQNLLEPQLAKELLKKGRKNKLSLILKNNKISLAK